MSNQQKSNSGIKNMAAKWTPEDFANADRIVAQQKVQEQKKQEAKGNNKGSLIQKIKGIFVAPVKNEDVEKGDKEKEELDEWLAVHKVPHGYVSRPVSKQ